jgi:hypothetical protein
MTSNQVESVTGGTDSSSAWDISTFGPATEAYITLVGGTDDSGIFTRLTTLTWATTDGYLAYHSSGNNLQIWRVDNGSWTQLGADVAHTVGAGDKIGLESSGSTHTFYLDDGGAGWASQFTRTDGTYTSAGYIGAYNWTASAPMDDFGGGTVAAGVTMPVFYYHYAHPIR